MHTQMMAHVASAIDQNNAEGVPIVTSMFVIDAWRVVMRITEIAHVLPREFGLAHTLQQVLMPPQHSQKS
jgi:hypothetical protein